MAENQEHKFIIRADFFGIITSNGKTTFWLPKARGLLYFDKNQLHFNSVNNSKYSYALNFSQIIKVKLESLNPRKNKWCSSVFSTPYYLLFWIPFWNRYILNITFLDDLGYPKEIFFRLKTRGFSEETLMLLRKSMAYSKGIKIPDD